MSMADRSEPHGRRMQAARPTRAQVRDGVFLCCLLIAAQLFLFAPIAFRWARGLPPSYPGQYLSRLLGTIASLALMSTLLVALGDRYRTSRGRLAYWLLLAVALSALVAQVVTD